MSDARAEVIAGLRRFVATIQKPNMPIDGIADTDGLVAAGLIDSLAIVQIVLYLESRYGIDFASSGIDPERLASFASIADMVMERHA
jgi:D-alanine--poly(phosphoribitol) ligase subunit 2